MAHKVLNSDMAKVIDSMKLAQQYSNTLMDNEYRKGMLKTAHVLAMDCKHLLDTVDNARKLKSSQNNCPASEAKSSFDSKLTSQKPRRDALDTVGQLADALKYDIDSRRLSQGSHDSLDSSDHLSLSQLGTSRSQGTRGSGDLLTTNESS